MKRHQGKRIPNRNPVRGVGTLERLAVLPPTGPEPADEHRTAFRLILYTMIIPLAIGLMLVALIDVL